MHRRLPDRVIVDELLDAYRQGAFPMADPRSGRVEFYSADPRGILPLAADEGFHVPARLERRLRQQPFDIRCDTSFERVMRGCALPRRASLDADNGTWINDTLIEWYLALHRAGHAHSVEAWSRPAPGQPHEPPTLVGGIYGVALGAAFIGESMFALPRPRRPDGSRHPADGTDAGKVCLVTLVRHLRALGFELFDTQMVTPQVARFGGREIPEAEYLGRLALAVERPERWRALR